MYPFTVRTSLDLFIYLEEVPGSVDMPLCKNGEIRFILNRDSSLHRGGKKKKKNSGQLSNSGDSPDL